MNTLGEKVPSCQRSEGSPLSEYEVPRRPPVPLFFSGLAFFELVLAAAGHTDLFLPITLTCCASPELP